VIYTVCKFPVRRASLARTRRRQHRADVWRSLPYRLAIARRAPSTETTSVTPTVTPAGEAADRPAVNRAKSPALSSRRKCGHASTRAMGWRLSRDPTQFLIFSVSSRPARTARCSAVPGELSRYRRLGRAARENQCMTFARRRASLISEVDRALKAEARDDLQA
jgi:hypothetical protein